MLSMLEIVHLGDKQFRYMLHFNFTFSFIEFCESENVGTPEAYGIFVWPDTPVGNRSTLPCPYNPESFASRECLYAKRTESGNVWGPIDVTKCQYNDVRSKDLFLLAQVSTRI